MRLSSVLEVEPLQERRFGSEKHDPCNMQLPFDRETAITCKRHYIRLAYRLGNMREHDAGIYNNVSQSIMLPHREISLVTSGKLQLCMRKCATIRTLISEQSKMKKLPRIKARVHVIYGRRVMLFFRNAPSISVACICIH